MNVLHMQFLNILVKGKWMKGKGGGMLQEEGRRWTGGCIM